MKSISILPILVFILSTPAFAQPNPDGSITTNDRHDYVSAEHETLTFLKKAVVIDIYYKNSPKSELSKISVNCMNRHKSFQFNHPYFVSRTSHLVDTDHDEHGHLTEACFQMEIKTDVGLKEPDRVLYIECADGKIEISALDESVAP